MINGGYDPIVLSGITVTLSGTAVIQDLSLTLPGSGGVCLFGPSGCGKTTLARLLAGLLTPDAGDITGLAGRTPMMVFQEDRLLPWLTAWENVALVMREPDPGRVRMLLEAVGLSDAMALHPHALSGGMRRRVALARGLAYGGDLLILDEPFQGLDERIREQVTDLLLHARGCGLLVLVTHDRHEAARLTETIIDFSGPPLTVKHEKSLPAKHP